MKLILVNSLLNCSSSIYLKGLKLNQLLRKLISATLIVLFLSNCSSTSANTVYLQPNIPVIECTSTLEPTALELEVIERINQLRTRPKSFIPLIEAEYATMNKKGAYLKNGVNIITQEGKKAVKEAISFIKRVKPVGKLERSGCLSLSAQDHVFEQGPKGLFGHASLDGSDPNQRAQRYSKSTLYCGENIAYGLDDALGIVIQLLVDDGVANRGHRDNLFRPEFNSIGVANGYHSVYNNMSSHTMCRNTAY